MDPELPLILMVLAKSALQMLADLAGYDFVYVKSNLYIVLHLLSPPLSLLGKSGYCLSHASIRPFLHLDLHRLGQRLSKE